MVFAAKPVCGLFRGRLHSSYRKGELDAEFRKVGLYFFPSLWLLREWCPCSSVVDRDRTWTWCLWYSIGQSNSIYLELSAFLSTFIHPTQTHWKQISHAQWKASCIMTLPRRKKPLLDTEKHGSSYPHHSSEGSCGKYSNKRSCPLASKEQNSKHS